MFEKCALPCTRLEISRGFPTRIREGISQSHALLAWYSPEYEQSIYCQKELTACVDRLSEKRGNTRRR